MYNTHTSHSYAEFKIKVALTSILKELGIVKFYARELSSVHLARDYGRSSGVCECFLPLMIFKMYESFAGNKINVAKKLHRLHKLFYKVCVDDWLDSNGHV